VPDPARGTVASVNTTLRVDGANCSLCFNDTLDELRAANGVAGVQGSIFTSLIDVAHDASITTATLATILRNRLHGIEMYANEIRMVPLAPVAVCPQCTHGQPVEASG